MKNPYKARVNTRAFLNLPGFYGGAYVVCYVEDTSERSLEDCDWGEKGRKHNPEPRFILEIADCSRRINLEFEIDSALNRMNSFHKIDTLIAALQEFRAGMAEECTEFKRRERVLRAYNKLREENKEAIEKALKENEGREPSSNGNGYRPEDLEEAEDFLEELIRERGLREKGLID